MARRQFLAQLAGLPFLSLGAKAEEPKKKVLKIMMKSAWGSDDPPRPLFRSCMDSRSPKPATKFRFSFSAKPPH